MIIACCSSDIYADFIHNSVNELLTWLDVIYDPKFLDNVNSTYCIEKYKELPKVILILEICKNIKEVRETYKDSKIVIYTNDVHYFNEQDKLVKYNTYLHSDYIVAYYNKIKRFYDINKPVFHITHNCCSIFKRDEINKKAIKKIFFYGNSSKGHYPLRVEFLNNMKKYKDKIVIKKHPGYVFKNKQEALKQTNETSQELYKYFCAFTCGLFPDFEIKEQEQDDFYLIGKFFEIMGNGVLLLCNDWKVKSQLESLGFYRDLHYIHIDNSNFNSVINQIFDSRNESKINEIRERAHKHCIENYYSAKINRKLNNFLLTLEKNEDVSKLITSSK